jgi:hypothetical protein
MGTRSKAALRAFAGAVVALGSLTFLATSPAAADDLQSRVSGEGVTIGQIDPNTVVSRDGGTTWQSAYVVAAGGQHPFDGWYPQANVSPDANWINCANSFTACLNETVWYRTFIVLPDRPDLSLSFRVLADNAATPFINGQPAGPRFESFGSVQVDPALLHPGVNTFDMLFEDWGGLTGFRWELFGTLAAAANPDSDHDGTPDPDGDGDGVPDTTDNCAATANLDQVNSDTDGAGNVCDEDDDNDGVFDTDDAFPTDAGESADSDGDGTGDHADADDDYDGVIDTDDPFTDDWALQIDTDGDGIGDNADTDDDNDGVLDTDDAFPKDAAESADNDGDGVGDNADTDDDQDGIADSDDAFPHDAAESADNDHDGIGDNADSDDDNDGVADTSDAFPLNPSESVDTDHDGTGNNADTDDDDDGLADTAEPGKGTNALDPDTDDDGVLDGADTLPLNPTVGAVAVNANGLCNVVRSFATKNGAAVSLCNHLEKAQKSADKHDLKGFTSAMSTFDKELTAQTNGRNAAISLPDAATIRQLTALWIAQPW